MKSCWALVLLVGCMASAATAQSQLNFNEAVSLAVDFYNRGLAVNNTFQLLRTAPSGDVVSRGESPGAGCARVAPSGLGLGSSHRPRQGLFSKLNSTGGWWGLGSD